MSGRVGCCEPRHFEHAVAHAYVVRGGEQLRALSMSAPGDGDAVDGRVHLGQEERAQLAQAHHVPHAHRAVHAAAIHVLGITGQRHDGAAVALKRGQQLQLRRRVRAAAATAAAAALSRRRCRAR
eukprot:scaffold50608_cov37-Phaeocystis_antarctica.AAC.2